MPSKKNSWISNNARFAVAYLGLGVVVVAAVAALVIGVFALSTKASKESVESVQQRLDPTRDQIAKAACSSVVQDAASAGVIVDKCALSDANNSLDVKGDKATAIVFAESQQTGLRYVVVVYLTKGIWSPLKAQVQGSTDLPKKKSA